MKFFKKLYKFLEDVANDPRIPARDKKVLLALIVLIISPVDFIPDWIPVIGMLDDFVISCIIMDYFFSVLDTEIILSHYPWGMKSFSAIRRFSRGFGFFVPSYFKAILWKYAKLPYL